MTLLLPTRLSRIQDHMDTMLATSTDAEIAWAAGLFEGEGSGTLMHPRQKCTLPSVRFVVSSTDGDVVRRFAKIVCVGKVSGPHAPIGAGKKSFFVWKVEGTKAVAIYNLFEPWLGERRITRIGGLISEVYPGVR